MIDGLYVNLLNLCYALAIAGGIIVFITTGANNINGVSALISGYSALIFSIAALMVLLFNNLSRGLSTNDMQGMIKMFVFLFPFIMILFVLILMLTFLSIYFDRITNNKVSGYYTSFSIVTTIFLALQLGIVFNALSKSDMFKSSAANFVNAISATSYAMLMLIGALNSIAVITLGIILKYYTTDC